MAANKPGYFFFDSSPTLLSSIIVQTVLSLVARGVADAVMPVSATRAWVYPQALHVARIQTPAIRNVMALAVPLARPATRLSRTTQQILRQLVQAHF